MLRPSVKELIPEEQSTYSLCVGVAKRAREITDRVLKDNAENKETRVIVDKPVKLAVDELKAKKYKIVPMKDKEEA